MDPKDPNDQSSERLESGGPPLDPADESSNDRPTDQTEETIQWDAGSDQSTTEIPPQPTEGSPVFSGTGSNGSTIDDATEETADSESFLLADELDKTLPNIDATVEIGTVEIRPPLHRTPADSTALDSSSIKSRSVMQSRDVSQTINPRELSKEEAAFWGSAALGASKANKAEQSKLRPAVERSITESKLQLRKRDLAVPTRDQDVSSDYRLIRLLGRGGMGNVYVARQASLDRMIAVKVIKPLPKAKRQSLHESGRLDEVEYERRQQFLSEAVVTGDLDHPNIVPIHDIALAADDTLFYAMKRVVGQPWLKTIDERSRDENLEILLKVCDAIAFAWSRSMMNPSAV